jgi:chemotaxis protein methyltransferase CheR
MTERAVSTSYTVLRPDEFRMLRDLVNSQAGLQYDDGALVLFERRLGERVSALGLPSFSEYYKYLRFSSRGSAEIEELIERLVTSETYFFRQAYQLRSFQDELLPILARENASHRRLTVWSAGCATGEEVYTLAILVLESRLFRDFNVRIIGSDISRPNVAFARHGVYRPGSFRVTPAEARRSYFEETAGGARVRDEVRRICHFGQLNLLDPGRTNVVGRVDVVFCRNVLIYFDERSRRSVIENLYERLVPGGYLLLGHSESLINVTTAFELVHLSEDLAYRRPLFAGRQGART